MDTKHNLRKTKYLLIGAKAAQLNMDNNQKISPCNKYIYQGVIFVCIGNNEREIGHINHTSTKSCSMFEWNFVE